MFSKNVPVMSQQKSLLGVKITIFLPNEKKLVWRVTLFYYLQVLVMFGCKDDSALSYFTLLKFLKASY